MKCNQFRENMHILIYLTSMRVIYVKNVWKHAISLFTWWLTVHYCIIYRPNLTPQQTPTKIINWMRFTFRVCLESGQGLLFQNLCLCRVYLGPAFGVNFRHWSVKQTHLLSYRLFHYIFVKYQQTFCKYLLEWQVRLCICKDDSWRYGISHKWQEYPVI